MASVAGAGNEVLVCAPYGGDAESLSTLLARHGTAAVVCPGMAALAAGIGEATAAVLVTEEALRGDLAALNDALERQPSWSDLPFIVLASRGANRSRELEILRRHLPPHVVNLMLLERPLSAGSLLSAVASAVRSRQKQFEIRDTIAELDRQKTRLVTLLDHLPVGVAFIGPGLETLLTNPAFRRFQPNGEIPSRSADGEDRWIGFEEMAAASRATASSPSAPCRGKPSRASNSATARPLARMSGPM